MSYLFAFLIGSFFWLALCVLLGILATSFNRSGILFFVVALIASPLIAAVLLIALGKKSPSTKTTGAPKLKCPKCNTVNDPQARYCSGCGVQIVGAKTD